MDAADPNSFDPFLPPLIAGDSSVCSLAMTIYLWTEEFISLCTLLGLALFRSFSLSRGHHFAEIRNRLYLAAVDLHFIKVVISFGEPRFCPSAVGFTEAKFLN